PGVPDTSFVSRVTPSNHDVNAVYASFDNHWAGDYKPYLLKSTDLGRSWTSIAGNLPARGSVYVVIDDPVDANLLFAGTEFGLYFTRDGGRRWQRLRSGLPTIAVFDLAIQKRESDLVVATFGRGFYVLDDLTPLRALTPAVLAADATLFPVKRAPMYVESSPLGGAGASFQGGSFYTAANPPFGATITYYLKDELRTRRAQRQQAERAAGRRGEDVFYPAWDSLRVEDREEPPAIVVTVSDAGGHVVRRLTGPVTAGIHRVAWDLRYPATNPPTAGRGGGAGGGGGGAGGGGEAEAGAGRGPTGPMVLPGTYQVAIAKRVDGVTTPLGTPQRFDVYMLDPDATPRSPAVVAFQQQTAKLQRAVLGANALAGEAMEQLQALQRALEDTPSADEKLASEARALQRR